VSPSPREPVRDLLAQVALVAGQLGDQSAARMVSEEAARGEAHAARVVVVGEKKRGKSSLINALLRWPDLLPVDVDIATGVHIALSYTPEPSVEVFTDSDVSQADEDAVEPAAGATPPSLRVGLDQIAGYGALDPVTGVMRHDNVTRLQVGLPAPLLEAGLVLVDTPGVGGLISGHGALTLAALAQADALLFVVSGASELTASECEFLHRAAQRVTTVVFVLTQTDKYPSWRETLARSQDLIREHAPRFADAPWYAVSSRLRLDAQRARDVGDPDTGAARDRASGFGPLEETLRTSIAGTAQALRERNARYVARRVVDKHLSAQQQRLRSLAHDPQLLAAVTADRDRLTALLQADAAWRSRLAQEFKSLDRELSRIYQRLVVEYQQAAEQRVAAATPADAREMARDLDAGVRALWAELEIAARRGIDALTSTIAADFAADGVDALDIHVPYPPELRLPEFEGAPTKPDTTPMAYVERYAPGMSMAFLLGHLVPIGILGASVVGAPVAFIAVGGLLGHAMYKRRTGREAEARLRSDLQRYLQVVLRNIHTEVPPALQDGLERALRTVEQGISVRVSERRAELEAALAEHSANLAAAEADLAPRREAARAALARLQDLAQRLAA
jgi:hypothetical protein